MICSSAVLAALLVPALVQAQTPYDNQQAIEKRVAADREVVKQAYATNDPKKIADAKERLNKDYQAQWEATHPESIKEADAKLARTQAETKAALATNDPKRIEAAKATERQAYQEDWMAHHHRPD
jgi:hypothetical protein